MHGITCTGTFARCSTSHSADSYTRRVCASPGGVALSACSRYSAPPRRRCRRASRACSRRSPPPSASPGGSSRSAPAARAARTRAARPSEPGATGRGACAPRAWSRAAGRRSTGRSRRRGSPSSEPIDDVERHAEPPDHDAGVLAHALPLPASARFARATLRVVEDHLGDAVDRGRRALEADRGPGRDQAPDLGHRGRERRVDLQRSASRTPADPRASGADQNAYHLEHQIRSARPSPRRSAPARSDRCPRTSRRRRRSWARRRRRARSRSASRA